MRIAHLIDSLHWGGAQKLLILFAEAASARGLDFTIISLRPNTKNSPYPAQLKAMGVRVIELSIDRLYSPGAVPSLVRLFRREKFDVVQTHLQHANILGALAGAVAGVPVIATLHSTKAHVQGFFHSPRQWVDRFLLRHVVKRVVAVGYSVSQAHQSRLSGRKIDIIPNAIGEIPALASADRERLRRKLLGSDDGVLILTVGRLTIDKGYHDLIAAFSRIAHQHPQARLVIVGDGELRADLDKAAADSGLQNRISLLGPRTDVPDLLAASDMYVSSSHREGLSLALMEAMAAGLPIVATRVGDTEYLLRDGIGVMVEPHDVPSIAREMSALLDAPSEMLKMGKSAHDFITAHYAPKPWLERLLELYEQARH